MTITKDMVSNDGTAVTNLAPPERRATADETYDTVFWQARVLSNWQHQTTENDDDKTASGTEIDSIRFQNNKFQYHDKNENRWESFNSSNDQLVFYYLIRTDYSQMVQIDVSDWTVKDEPSNLQYPSHRGVTYQVIVDGGNDNGKVLDSKTFWYNRDLTVSAIRVRQTQSENYTISKVELTPNNLGTVAKKNGEYQFSLNLKNANTDEATVKIYVQPKVQPKQLSYELGGGTITSNASDYTVAGEVYPDAPVVTPSVSKDGYTFGGWYTDANFQNQWTGTTMPNENLMLHAKWTATNPDPKPDPDPDPTPKATDVYVYFKMVDAAGNNISRDKINNEDLKKTVYNKEAGGATWATLGKIASAETLTDGTGYKGTNTTLVIVGNEAKNQLKDNALYKKNKGIATTVLANIEWFQLKQCAGATDYVSDGSRWHLDGKITGYTVTYNKGTTEATADDVHNMPVDEMYYLRGSDYTVSDATPTRDGYVFTGWKSNIENDTTIYNAKGKFDMPAKNVVLTAQWEKDTLVDPSVGEPEGITKGDGIADKYQIQVNFKAVNGTFKDGKNSITEYTTVVTKYDNSTNKPSENGTAKLAAAHLKTATPNEGHKLTGWTKNNTGCDAPGVGTSVQNNDYFVVTFAQEEKPPIVEPTTKIKYTINQHFMNAKGSERTDLAHSDRDQSANKDTALSELIKDLAKDRTKDGSTYVYVPGKTTYTVGTGENKRTENLVAAATLTEDTTIDLYYYLDNWKDTDEAGKDSETGGDGIPDCDQVLIKYVSSNSERGTVFPDMEVLTLRKDNENVQIKINGSKATDNGGRNYFSNWTEDNTQVSTNATLNHQTILDVIKKFTGGKTYTFTANFDRSSGGGSGGSNRPKPPVVEIPDDVPTGLNGKDHYAYIIGYGNNDVRPQNNITRAEVATIFFRLLTDETRTANMTKSNGYNDVKDGDWFCCAVSTLSKIGIIKAYQDGSFQPNDPISRAEFAAIAARFDPDGDKTPASFADVTSHWAKDEISIAANHGWIKGYEDGSFKPDQEITRAETMTLVNRVLNRLPEAKDDLHKDMKTWVDNMDETAWYYLAVQEATNSHYFKNKTGTKFEQWTDLRDTRDWSELEK